jgi:hypothetical protein
MAPHGDASPITERSCPHADMSGQGSSGNYEDKLQGFENWEYQR